MPPPEQKKLIVSPKPEVSVANQSTPVITYAKRKESERKLTSSRTSKKKDPSEDREYEEMETNSKRNQFNRPKQSAKGIRQKE